MGSQLLQLHWLFKVSALVILFFVSVFCEDNSLDSIPTASFQPPSDSNRNTCINASIWSQNSHLCINQGLLYPKVKTFLLDQNQGICLTRYSQDQFSASRSQVMTTNTKTNFTNCFVSNIQYNTKTSSSSCDFIRRLVYSLKNRRQLIFAVLNCPRLSKRESYCLVLVPSRTPRNWATVKNKYCSRRTLWRRPHAVLSSTQPPQPTLLHSTTVEPSAELDSPSDSFIGFIRNKPYIFGGIVAGFVVFVIVIIALVCWCCYRKKKRVFGLQGLQLTPCTPQATMGGKESPDSPVYHEPDIRTSQYRNRPAVQTRGYDYAYQHHVRGPFTHRRDPCDVTDVKATESDYDNGCPVRDEDIGKCEQYPPLKKSGAENQEGYRPLPSSQPPPVKPKPLPYVKVF